MFLLFIYVFIRFNSQFVFHVHFDQKCLASIPYLMSKTSKHYITGNLHI